MAEPGTNTEPECVNLVRSPGIDSLESISGLLKRLQIRAQAENTWEGMESNMIRSSEKKTRGVEVRMVDERIQ